MFLLNVKLNECSGSLIIVCIYLWEILASVFICAMRTSFVMVIKECAIWNIPLRGLQYSSYLLSIQVWKGKVYSLFFFDNGEN